MVLAGVVSIPVFLLVVQAQKSCRDVDAVAILTIQERVQCMYTRVTKRGYARCETGTSAHVTSQITLK